MPSRDPETLHRVLKELDDVASEAARFEKALEQAHQLTPAHLQERRIAPRRRISGRRRGDRPDGEKPA